MRASPSNLTIIWALLINVPTILMAAAWFVMSVFATAIGSKPPTPSEYMAILWPAVAGSAVRSCPCGPSSPQTGPSVPFWALWAC